MMTRPGTPLVYRCGRPRDTRLLVCGGSMSPHASNDGEIDSFLHSKISHRKVIHKSAWHVVRVVVTNGFCSRAL